MRYQRLDLNLLVALRALLTERSVTRAAHSVNVTQSAMSGILARLREYFEDPLIVQVGRRMDLTQLGQSLQEPVNDLLVRIDTTLGTRPEFDPATTRRRFSIMASDYVISVLLADVLQRVHLEAPGVSIELRSPSKDSTVQLESGDLDLLVTPELFTAAGHACAPLYEDDYCVVVDRDNPDVGETLSLAQFSALRHVSFESQGKPFFETWFERTHGEIRQVEVTAHSFQLLPLLLVGTKRVATMHSRMAQRIAASMPVKLAQLDFAVPRILEVLQWHKLRDLDPGSQWLRHCIIGQAARLVPLPGPLDAPPPGR
jgi:LysR family transcriptional regulator, nod-box dependent transcriptional activator